LSIQLIVSGLQFAEYELAVLAALDAGNFGSGLQNSHDHIRNWRPCSIRELSADASKWLESQLVGAIDFGTQLAGREKNSDDDRCEEDALSFHKILRSAATAVSGLPIYYRDTHPCAPAS
jgi:hypothetical protein